MYLLCVLYVLLLPLLLCRRAVLAVRLRLILRIRRSIRKLRLAAQEK